MGHGARHVRADSHLHPGERVVAEAPVAGSEEAQAPPPERARAAKLARGSAWIPAFVFAGLTLGARVDAPALDDFDAVLEFLLDLRAAEGAAGLGLFLEPHVDHRVLLTRIAPWLQWSLFGRVDFAWLSLFGGALGAGLFGLLVVGRAAQATSAGAFGLLAASLLWFQPQAYALLNWPTASISTYAVFFFAVAAFACVRMGDARALGAAWLCCAAATLCLGNGSLAWPSVVFVLVLRGRLREAAGFTLAALPPLALYAATYRGHSEGAAHLLDPGRLGEVAVHACRLLGAVAGPLGATAAAWLGAGLAAACAAVGVGARRRLDVRVLGLGLFVLGTVAGNAVLRAGLGADYALSQPRYRLNSVLVILLVALGGLDWIRGRAHERRATLALCAVALAFSGVSYASYAPLVFERSASLARGLARWQLTGEGLSHSDPLRADATLRRAAKAGIYRARPAALARWLDTPSAGPAIEPSAALDLRLGRVVADGDFALVEGRVVSSPSRVGEVFVVLGSEEGGRVALSSRSRAVPTTAGPATIGFRSLFPRFVAGDRDAIGVLVATPDTDVWVDSGRRLPPAPFP